MSVEIFMDCGAPSLYNKLSKQNSINNLMGSSLRRRRSDDFSYTKTPEYRQYRKDYADFLLENKDILSTYSNLDVINNAELTYRNQKWFEKKGLCPLPVWHFGTDVSWLTKYLEEGYQYICIGGLTPNKAAVLKAPLDRIWSEMLVDENGIPKVKVHGFAMTSFDLMFRYPWYSVDSKSWIDHSRFGKILVPHLHGAEWNWRVVDRLAVTNHSVHIRHPDKHIRTMDTKTRNRLLRYLDFVGVPLGKSESKEVDNTYKLKIGETWLKKVDKEKEGSKGLVEVPIVMGVSNSHIYRMEVNLFTLRGTEGSIPEWPWCLWDAIPKPNKRLSLFDLKESIK